MQLSDFHYDLPPELIAQRPPEQRGDSRLLTLDSKGALADRRFQDLPELLRPGDLLVFNDTRVIPARLRGRKASGGRVEMLLERLLDERVALVQLRASRAPRVGTELQFENELTARVRARRGALFELQFELEGSLLEVLQRCGEVPLPPYIERSESDTDGNDRERYQTIYARHPGAVAAPTAGLHFDDTMLARLAGQGIGQTFLTLHVGAGTFQPVRSESIAAHHMHAEQVHLGDAACDQIRAAKTHGGRVIAVGTTVVRSLEAIAERGGGELHPFDGETDIFITPGFRFRCVDALLTNFHLPQSTLLMLIAAFAGYPQTMAAYRHAVAQRYRFFSYGDAMFIEAPVGSGA